MGPEVLALVHEQVFDLESRFTLQEVRQTDSGPFETKAGRQNPPKGETLLSRGIPESGSESFQEEEEAGGSTVELGPDQEFLSLENLLGPVAGQMDFETTCQERIALCNSFYRLDVVFIEARETGNTFIAITVKLRPGIADGHIY